MSKRLIYTKEDGNLSVVVPSPNYKGTIEELRDQLIERGDLIAFDEVSIVEADEIPEDRIFRDAWKKPKEGFTSVDIDLPKAKDVAHNYRRRKRNKDLKPLDAEVNVNIANPSKLNISEAKRQVVRDKYVVIQNNIDACDNVNALRNILNADGLI